MMKRTNIYKGYNFERCPICSMTCYYERNDTYYGCSHLVKIEQIPALSEFLYYFEDIEDIN